MNIEALRKAFEQSEYFRGMDMTRDGDEYQCMETQKCWASFYRGYVSVAGQLAQLLTATKGLIKWLSDCEDELGEPIKVGYRGRVQKPVAIARVRDAIAAVGGEE